MTGHGNTPNHEDLVTALEDAREHVKRIPDDGWAAQAAGLDWTCRETVAHILDDLGSYAMLLSGAHRHEGYTPLMEFTPVPGRTEGTFWPEEEGGTQAILDCLGDVGGLLVAVIATAPADRIGWHPFGDPDRTALAAMGITELVLHTHDILTAHDMDYRGPEGPVSKSLDRIFPHATTTRTQDSWHDLLTATGRTAETRGIPWRWNSSA